MKVLELYKVNWTVFGPNVSRAKREGFFAAESAQECLTKVRDISKGGSGTGKACDISIAYQGVVTI